MQCNVITRNLDLPFSRKRLKRRRSARKSREWSGVTLALIHNPIWQNSDSVRAIEINSNFSILTVLELPLYLICITTFILLDYGSYPRDLKQS